MGRKALIKSRKELSPKASLWVRQLFLHLQDKPLKKLTLDQIAVLTGKSKSTIYSYFTTKEEIYQTTVQLILADLEGAIICELPAAKSMEELYGELLLKISGDINGMSIHFLQQIQTDYPDIWQSIESFTEKLLESFKRIYEHGMQSGEFNFFNVDLLMAMDQHFVMSIITDTNRFSNSGLSLSELVTEYLNLRIKALTTN